MKLACTHLVMWMSDLGRAREFYADTLGLPILEDHPNLLALRAGDIRLSIFKGDRPVEVPGARDEAMALILRTENLDQTVAELVAKGAELAAEIQEDPSFMRFASLVDPDGNNVYLAQYYRDPLMPT
jgi:glyoxylase I family protein